MVIGKMEVTGWVFRPLVNERFPHVVENRGVGGHFADTVEHTFKSHNKCSMPCGAHAVVWYRSTTCAIRP